MDDVAVNVGNQNGMMCVILALMTGAFSVLLNALIAGKTGQDAGEHMKWTIICVLLEPILGIGYIMACCIACKSKKMSE